MQILFDNDKKVDVVTASVNEEKTLLGKVLVLTCEVYHVILYSSCRAAERGAGGGQIAPGPEVLGAPENFLLGPSLFCVINISAQRTRYLGFFWLSTEICHEKKR